MLFFFKKPLGIIIVVLLIFIGIGGFFVFKPDGPRYEFAVAQKTSIIEQVSVTGRVKPVESVDLAFEVSGKVAVIFADVGDSVAAGDILISLNDSELQARLAQGQADLAAAKASLAELQRGTREEEIQAAETKVQNSEIALKDAKENLVNVEEKASADLESAYSDSITAIQKAVNTAKNSLLVLTDIQLAHFLKADQESLDVQEGKAVAVESLLGKADSGRLDSESLSELKGGVFGSVQDLLQSSLKEDIDKGIVDTLSVLKDVKDALDAVPILKEFTATQKSDLAGEKTTIDSEIVTVISKQQAIAVQKAQNTSQIAIARSSINNELSALAVAQDDLTLKKAGATAEQLDEQEAKVQAARASIDTILAKLEKMHISSPIAGVIVKQDAKVGEIISAGDMFVSVISQDQFEIETFVPEADIAKISSGDKAVITLDAYGSGVVFEALVVVSDPAETIVEGVPTYKTTLQFQEEDDRVKSGMTANIDITTDEKEGVIVVPQRAVITKNGKKLVRVSLNGIDIQEIPITTGIRGIDGDIEIVEGLKEGDQVITFIKEK